MATSRIKTSSIVQGFPKSRSLLAGAGASYSSSYESIATVTVGAGGQSSISFTSIPGTYSHLQIRALFKTSVADRSIRITFNSDTATNYSFHGIGGDGSTVSLNAYGTQAYGVVGSAPNSTTYPGIFVTDILDYANTSKYKTTRSSGGADMNIASANSSYAQFWSSNWRSTSAITTITLVPSSGSFSQYSSFALYGIK
jgi:hypothetical protein